MNRLVLVCLAGLSVNLASADTVVFTGATVHTMGPAGTIENATVVIQDGRFSGVGNGPVVPAGATVIDAAGKIITPGFFSAIDRKSVV